MKYIYTLVIVLLTVCSLNAQSITENAQQLIAGKNYTQAQKVLKTALITNANNLKLIELLGDTYGYQKSWDLAINQYEKLKSKQPNNANYQYKFGGALGMKALSVNKFKALTLIGDVKSAFLKAAELDPKHIETRWALVELYMQLPGIIGGSKDKSLKFANQLYKLSPVDGYLAKGYIYEYDDEPELAEKYYKLAVAEGGSVTCYGKLSSFYETVNKPKKSIETLTKSNEIHKRNNLHYQIGKVCAEYNIELEKGEQYLLKYIKNYSVKDGVPKAWANYRLAQIYKHKANKNKALNYINLAIKELPERKVFQKEKQLIKSL